MPDPDSLGLWERPEEPLAPLPTPLSFPDRHAVTDRHIRCHLPPRGPGGVHPQDCKLRRVGTLPPLFPTAVPPQCLPGSGGPQDSGTERLPQRKGVSALRVFKKGLGPGLEGRGSRGRVGVKPLGGAVQAPSLGAPRPPRVAESRRRRRGAWGGPRLPRAGQTTPWNWNFLKGHGNPGMAGICILKDNPDSRVESSSG